MGNLARIAATGYIAALVLIYVAIFYQLLTGRINLAGLLRSKSGYEFDPGRLQALVVTLMLAGSMLLGLRGMEESHRISLPSNWLLLILGGSQGLYLVRKFLQTHSRTSWRDL